MSEFKQRDIPMGMDVFARIWVVVYTWRGENIKCASLAGERSAGTGCAVAGGRENDLEPHH